MKYIYNIFLLIGIMACLNSCDDTVDIIQPGELGEDNAITNVDDLQAALNDAYFGLNTDQAIQISSLFTDETSLGFENGGQNVLLYQFQFNTTSVIASNLWITNYFVINGVNRALLAAESIDVDDDEEARFNDILAQLRAIRAAEYFELLTYFSTDISDDDALGVMKLDFVPLIDVALPRVSNSEIFEFINTDLDFAKQFLDDSRTDPIFITDGFITAFEARMALYRGNNSLAISKAQELIDDYPLASPTEYRNVFRDVSSAGLIFKGERNQSNGSGQIAANFYFRNVGINGGAFMELSRSLFNLLDTDDARYNTLVQSQSIIDPDYLSNNGKDDILLIGKYPGSFGQPMQNDYKYFGVSEMYLIKAEAQANENDVTGAAITLKQLRDQRFDNPTDLDVYNNNVEALQAVQNERRIELAFEGHRYIDLKRLSPVTGLSIDRDPADCGILNACTLNSNDFYKFTFPIPAQELAGNSTIRSQQNPGYTNDN